ncbi:hypothetical protein BH09PAT2_BH09PAT2_03420 [soil metagenome]
MEHHSWLKIITLLSDLVVFDSFDFQDFLKKLIKLIIKLIPVDSCFIYILDHSKNELILVASKKPHKGQIGKITLKKGEGITGWAAETKKTIVIEKEAYKNKHFKHFDELPEDTFESFISIPIVDKSGSIGVINLQNRNSMSFNKSQIEMLEAIVKLISSAFSQVVLQKKIGELENKLVERKRIEKAKGILMKKDKMSEQEAYSLIRQEAMKKRKSLGEIAEAILLVWG